MPHSPLGDNFIDSDNDDGAMRRQIMMMLMMNEARLRIIIHRHSSHANEMPGSTDDDEVITGNFWRLPSKAKEKAYGQIEIEIERGSSRVRTKEMSLRKFKLSFIELLTK